MSNYTRRTVSLDAIVADQASREAASQNRSLSNYVNTLLKEAFASRKPAKRKRIGKMMREKGASK